jgi:exopolyphosphatase / guanosine-5'-triphosphate,3'-diphosphate pyrophosphatase
VSPAGLDPTEAREMAVAAVDCGTNSTRLLIADPLGRPLVRRMEITRLGEGVDRLGHLSAEAVKRTTDVLVSYRWLMDDAGVAKARLVTTSAARDATNVDEALLAMHQASSVEPEVLSGVEEGRLSYLGATSELDPSEAARVVADIGGGSTELAFHETTAGSHPEDHVGGENHVGGVEIEAVEVCSLDIGCVRVTERYLGHDPPTPEEMKEARAGVTAVLDETLSSHPALADATELIGLAGTVSALAQMRAGVRQYDRSVVHHARLDRDFVQAALSELAAIDVARRVLRPGMAPGRADVIVGGTLVLDALMEVLGFDTCLVSEADILDGLVLSQLGGGPTIRR